MFSRTLATQIKQAADTFYAVSVVGPRQSGKTTLLKMLFPDYTYLNLENPTTLERLRSDPQGYFAKPSGKWILDEAQEYPELFSYLLGFIDEYRVKGQFILSGSKNFLLLDQISQSLAGRIAILELLPLTYTELQSNGTYAKAPIWDLIYQGTYPGPYHDKAKTPLWYKSYVTTYLERDVRQILQVKNLAKFYLFLRLCAGRNGQLLNLSELGAACGISHTTASEWINLLEASYIIFRLQPYYRNFNKRLIKTPKLYFYDAGLVCHLLGIESPQHAEIHAARGALFEGYIISDIVKQFAAQAKTPHVYFWNSHKGFEIDLLIEHANFLKAVEIKSSATFSSSFFKQLTRWQQLEKNDVTSKSYVIYAGDESFSINDMQVISYKEVEVQLQSIVPGTDPGQVF